MTEKTYEVDPWNNFCRVIELPLEFPDGYCFGGGIQFEAKLVDWFNPVQMSLPGISKEEWVAKFGGYEKKTVTMTEMEETLVPFLKAKVYSKPGMDYIVIFNFGGAIRFSGGK